MLDRRRRDIAAGKRFIGPQQLRPRWCTLRWGCRRPGRTFWREQGAWPGRSQSLIRRASTSTRDSASSTQRGVAPHGWLRSWTAPRAASARVTTGRGARDLATRGAVRGQNAYGRAARELDRGTRDIP